MSTVKIENGQYHHDFHLATARQVNNEPSGHTYATVANKLMGKFTQSAKGFRPFSEAGTQEMNSDIRKIMHTELVKVTNQSLVDLDPRTKEGMKTLQMAPDI